VSKDRRPIPVDVVGQIVRLDTLRLDQPSVFDER
jgi:hypothetical protein